MNLANRVLKPLRSLWMVWLGLYIIAVLVVSGVSMLFASIGLNEVDKRFLNQLMMISLNDKLGEV